MNEIHAVNSFPNVLNTTEPDRPAPFLLRTLGTTELVGSGPAGPHSERLLGAGKPLALLAYCASARNRDHSRDLLASLLWPQAGGDRSRHNLRQALWRLRRAVGNALETRDDVVVRLDPSVATDREQFLDAAHRDDGEGALRAYGGPFLAGLSLPDGDAFEDWASLERRHLEESLLRVVEPYLLDLLRRGRPAQGREALQRLLQVAPQHVEARRIAVDVLLQLGDRAAARGEAEVLEQLAHTEDSPLTARAAAAVVKARESDGPETITTGELGRYTIAPLTLDLVGRTESFNVVLTAWRRARAGTTQIVLITGGAGIGKSRLLSAIEGRCQGRRGRAVSVRANPGEREVPFGFAAAIAHALASQPGAAGINSDSARELVALDPGLASLFAVPPSPTEGTEAVRRRALALFDLISAITEQEPLALLLDDLHWADTASRQLMAIVMGRSTDLALMVVATSRGGTAGLVEHRELLLLPLAMLEHEAVVDAIRSSGEWPEQEGAQHFIATMADACEGLPQAIVERLSLAQERGDLTLSEGRWTSPDWAHATQEIAIASPLDHRLRACTDVERALLALFAVAGTPLSTETLSACSPDAAEALRSLEAKSFLERDEDAWQPSHDVVLERIQALSSTEALRTARRTLAAALSASARHEGFATAVRLFVRANDDAQAAVVFARIVARARRSGDPRHVQDLLGDTVAEILSATRLRTLLSRVPVWQRAPAVRARVVAIAATLVAIVAIGMAWSSFQVPSLALAQTPASFYSANQFAAGAIRPTPALIVQLGDALPDDPPTMVRVHAVTNGADILAGDSVLSDSGVASFGALRLRVRGDAVVLRFEADGYRPLDFVLPRNAGAIAGGPGAGSVRVLDGQLAGQPLTRARARIEVAPGAAIDGLVQIEYNAQWSAASVWLAVSPTWGDAARVGQDLYPVATPVRREVIDVPITQQAPATPGRYWILMAISAEPAGGFIASSTNWTVGTPVWGDGNDLVSLPDSVLLEAQQRGLIRTSRAYALSQNESACRLGGGPGGGRPTLKYCDGQLAMTAVEVIVR
jgi:DNA-binding SARP family transcriptional activator